MKPMIHGGLIIKHFRELAGVSRRKIEKDCGFNRVSVRAWEVGRSEPRFTTVFYICEYMGFTTLDIFKFAHDARKDKS